ncbi:MAG TPA: ABC transporter substrate-binding protein [Anaerolineaceae bacterium]|nr:ABC transporter substrate-binding protein [Anaerolineaceae bacterium]
MRIRFYLLLALVAVLATACAAPTATTVPTVVPTVVPTKVPTAVPTTEPTAVPTPEKIIVTDALGRVVEFDKLPERVVIAGKATSLLIDTAYLFPRASQVIVAVEERLQNAQNFMPLLDAQWAGKAILETDASAEAIAPLQPDLVILKTYMADKLGAPLEQLGIKVVYMDLETPEAFYRDIATLGILFGDPARAEEVTAIYKSVYEDALSATASLSDGERPSVLLLQYSDKGGTVSFNVPPAGWLQTSLVEAAGGKPVWTADVTGSGWTVVTFEQIAAWNPDMVFLVDYKLRGLDIVEQLKADAQWSILPAVVDGKLFAFPGDFLSWDQPDARWILGLSWMAHIIQPDLFANYDIQADVSGFYSKMYGMDDATIKANILPLVEPFAP